MRETAVIIEDINKLVRSEGYIYSLSMLILENFHFDIEHLYDVEYNDLLGIQEVSLLIGFLLHEPIDFTPPKKPAILVDLKRRSIDLIKELEDSLLLANRKTYKSSLDEKETEQKQLNLFVKDGSIIEPIIYSGNGTYLYQYSSLLENRFKEDADWFKTNCGFTVQEALALIQHIQKRLHKKFKRFYSFMLKNKRRRNNWFNQPVKENELPIDFYPYMDLFSHIENQDERPELDDITEEDWQHFYKNLINLFMLNKSEMTLGNEDTLNAFLDKFATDQVAEYNEQFTEVGDYNHFRGHPILLMEPNKYFFPISFMLYEALYQSPFHWIMEDENYRDKHIANCGRFGQNTTLDFIIKQWGADNLYHDVQVTDSKGVKSTIDILYLLENKALIFQTKSGKLSQLSRQNNDEKIFDLFKEALQGIYEEGLEERDLLLDANTKLAQSDGSPIKLNQPLDEVYLVGVTIRNYPTIAHQAHRLLKCKKGSPYPIFITIFELDIMLHYLDNPFDFFYYIRQRTELADHFIATEELSYLGYHLCNRLHPIKESTMIHIDDKYASYIDRNYYPYKFKVDHHVEESRDPIENRWYNKWFDSIYKTIRQSDNPSRVDMAYSLLDLNPQSVDRLINQIQQLKQEVKENKKRKNFSAYVQKKKVGISLLALPKQDKAMLKEQLLEMSIIEKYKKKADFWIGLGFIEDSIRPFDNYIYLDEPWVFDKELNKKARRRRF